MEILLGGNKQDVKNITAGIKNNPDTGIYKKIRRPDRVPSDSIKDRVDAGFYLMIIKAEEMEKVMYGDRVKEFIPEKKKPYHNRMRHGVKSDWSN